MPQISLRDVGHMDCIMDQHMIPWPILWRTTFGHLFVPFLIHIKLGVDVHDHPSVVESIVVYDFPDSEYGSTFWHIIGISDHSEFVNLESE